MVSIAERALARFDATIEELVTAGSSQLTARGIVLAAVVDVLVRYAYRDGLNRDALLLAVREHLEGGPGTMGPMRSRSVS